MAGQSYSPFTKWTITVLWTAVVLAAGGFVLSRLALQVWAYRYPATDGVVTHSRVAAGRTQKGGTTHRLELRYDYEVGGQKYTGTRYSYLDAGSGGDVWRDAQKDLPAGKRVPVYYDPADPADAVLVRGPTGFHLFILWALTPFAVVMVSLWGWCLRRPAALDPTPTPAGWVVALPPRTRAAMFLSTLLGVTFLGIFAIGLPTGFNPPAGLMAGAFAGVAALAAGAAVFLARYPTLEVDEVARVLRLPGGAEVPFAAVEGVEVAEEEVWAKPKKGEASVRYHVGLHRTGEPKPVRVATYDDRADADRLADWLREKVKPAG